MNYKTLAHYLGLVLKMQAVVLLVPLPVALWHGENPVAAAFAWAAALCAVVGLGLGLWGRKDTNLRLRESYILLALGWIAMCLTGALPYWFGGAAGFGNSLFESVSGFTTTGASVFGAVEELPRGLVFWRGLSAWIGGLAMLFVLTAIAHARWGQGGGRILRMENSGLSWEGQRQGLRKRLRYFWGIYSSLTAAQTLLLALGGMPLFDSLLTAMATASTGGFSVRSESLAAYGSPYIEAVTAVFMVLCGLQYGVLFLLLARDFAPVRQNEELRVYAGVGLVAALLVAWNVTGTVYPHLGQALRYGGFQVVSVLTTTGFHSGVVTDWPEFSQIVLLLLMLVGACGGSVGGGLKLFRVLIMGKEMRRSLLKMVQPRLIAVVKINGRALTMDMLHMTNVFILLYVLVYGVSFLLLSADTIDAATAAGLAAACLGNVGGQYPMTSTFGGNESLSALSKGVLMAAMLLGRLEIYPLLMLVSPRARRRL